MGSTVSAAYFANGSMIVANVGDSPIWLVHEGEIEMLSVEHTVLGEQLATAHGEGKDASRAFNHMLTRAIGVEPTVKADVSEVPCFAGDILVMASDGLSNKVPAQEILELTSRETPQTVCRLLVELANERGGEDNITVIVAKVKAVQRGRRGFVRAIRQVIREYCGVWWKEKE
jgi:protein phosphatase